MRKPFLLLPAILILLLIPLPAENPLLRPFIQAAKAQPAGTTYYVDYAGGSDSNSGTSPPTAWQHCPGDDNAANIAKATILTAGDRVIFKGGVVYVGRIDVDWSGLGDADVNRIIYDGDSGTYATRWGSGSDKAIIDGDGYGNTTGPYIAAFYISGSTKQYVTINNFEMRNAAHVSATTPGYGKVGSVLGWGDPNPHNYITVSNSRMHDNGYLGDGSTTNGEGVLSIMGDGWKIFNNIIYNCYWAAMEVSKGSYNKVYNNTIYGDMHWAVVMTFTQSFDVTDNEFYGNTIYNMGKTMPPVGHTDWFMIYTYGGTGKVSNTRIYNNLFYNDYDSPVEWGSGFIYISNDGNALMDGLYIYGNVMFNGAQVSAAGIDICPSKSNIQNLYIYNNAYYAPSNVRGNACHLAGPGGFENVYIKNNIFAHAGTTPSEVISLNSVTGTTEIDYNFYYSPSNRPLAKDGSYYNISTWRSTFGYDQHGIGTATDPLFVRITPSSFDLRLQSTSPAKDAGTSLGAPYNIDKDSVSRPQGSSWDIGAYEYVGAAPPPDTFPPTVSITTPTSGSIVSGSSVTVSANASDNVGVVGVQFKLDGANLGSEDTTSPYSITWNTVQTSNGAHTLTATARDAAGNQKTSAGINVTVNNTAPSPTDDLLLHYDFENNFIQGTLIDRSTTGDNANCQLSFYPNNDPSKPLITANQCPQITTRPSGGQAAQFSGSTCLLESDYFAILNPNSLTNLSEGTVSVWVNYNPLTDPDFLVPSTTYGLQRVLDTYLQGVNYSWALWKNYGPQTQVTLNRGDHELNLLTFPDPGVSNSWNHYAFTWNDTTARAYYNGLLVQEVAKSDVPYLAFSDYIAMGALKHNYGKNFQTSNCVSYYSNTLYYYRDNGYPGYENPLTKTYVMPNAGFLNGKLDELRIYNRALTQSEIQQSMNSGGGTCIHESDLDCSGCVDGSELTAFITKWYVSSTDVTLKELMEAIGLWKGEEC